MSSSVLPYSIELRNYLWEKGLDENPVLKRLREETENHPFALMQICPEQGALMANLVSLISAKKAIEVGTFTGYSALAVALALPEDGYLLACDISEEFTSIGKPYWEEAGVSENIDLQIAPAIETLKSKIEDGESNTYDFAFIDADKINYLNYYELCLDLIRSGGVIAIDNVLWGGSVIDSARTDDDTKAIREINDFIVSDKRVNISMIWWFFRVGDSEFNILNYGIKSHVIGTAGNYFIPTDNISSLVASDYWKSIDIDTVMNVDLGIWVYINTVVLLPSIFYLGASTAIERYLPNRSSIEEKAELFFGLVQFFYRNKKLNC